MLDKNAKIYVAGHHGLVGSAIWNNLLQRGYTNLVGRSHKELDLTDQVAVRQFFDEEKPDAVVLAAAFEKPLILHTKKGAAAACGRIAERIKGYNVPISI